MFPFTARGPERICATGGRVATSVAAAAANRVRLESRRAIALDACTHFRLLYGNYIVELTGGRPEVDTGNGYELELSVEIEDAPTPGPVRVTFAGASEGAVPDGAAAFASDRIPASAFGWDAIPAGTIAYVKDSLLVAEGENHPRAASFVNGDGEGACQSDAAESQVMTPGALVTPEGGAAVTLRTPMVGVVGALTENDVSLWLGGDSIVAYTADSLGSGIEAANGGVFVRATWDVGGRTVPWANTAVGGATAIVTAENLIKRLAIARYATHAIINTGTQDISTAAGTLEEIMAANRLIWQALADAGCSVEQVLILPRTTGTSSSAAGQTIRTDFGAGELRDDINDEIEANVGSNGLSGVIDLNATFEDQAAPGKWISTGGVAHTDGTHPSGVGLTVGAAALSTHYAGYA